MEIHLDGSTLAARQQQLNKGRICNGRGLDTDENAEHLQGHQPESDQS